MIKANRYKIIFLDWDGTMSGSRFWGQWDKGENKKIYNKIQKDFFTLQSEFIVRWMKGEETAETCATLLAEITGKSSSALLSALEASCRHMNFISERLPGQIRVLRNEGVRVVIATDNMDTFLRWTVPGMGLRDLVDDILDSHSLSALKREALPSGRSAFFSNYLETHSLLPDEALLIDDNIKNKVVESFGIHFDRVTPNRGLVRILDSLSLRHTRRGNRCTAEAAD
jgi:FMN phosphatase YigB (HAD superfamily)